MGVEKEYRKDGQPFGGGLLKRIMETWCDEHKRVWG